jgi:hypothetical protein
VKTFLFKEPVIIKHPGLAYFKSMCCKYFNAKIGSIPFNAEECQQNSVLTKHAADPRN